MKPFTVTVFFSIVSLAAETACAQDRTSVNNKSGENQINKQYFPPKAELEHQKTKDSTIDATFKQSGEKDESKRGRYGSVLGRGFSLGKRIPVNRDLMVREMSYFRQGLADTAAMYDKRDFETTNGKVDIENSKDAFEDKRWILPDIYGGGYFNKREKRDVPSKRYIQYFGNVLGRGFSIGKRDDEFTEDAVVPNSIYDNGLNFYEPDINDFEEKRGILGRGYMFGKRRMYGERPRRYFGRVLGGGFAMGKRDSSDGTDTSLDLFPDVEGESFAERKAELNEENEQHKRYFHSSPGYRFMFGKRGPGDIEKRYGFLLGRPFSNGKKRFINSDQNKRPFGLVLGNGFSLGKRFSTPDEVNDNADEGAYSNIAANHPNTVDKRAGYILGRGFMFGKRGAKRFGWVLGNGLSFGKRSDDNPKVLNSNNKNDYYFVDEDGYVYTLNDNENSISDIDDPELNFDDDIYHLEEFEEEPTEFEDDKASIVKRGFGLILGRGLGFGKRAPSWKRFGHVLGSGYLGK